MKFYFDGVIMDISDYYYSIMNTEADCKINRYLYTCILCTWKYAGVSMTYGKLL